MAVSLFAQWRLHRTFARYSQLDAVSGLTGAQIARRILERSGILDVTVEAMPGRLIDHFDPTTKRLILSEENFNGTSVASLGVAAHECGHAIQQQQLYAPLQLRMAAVGITNIASQIIWWIPLVAFFGRLISFKLAIMLMTVAFGVLMLFQLITLPVEFDATARAKRVLADIGALRPGEETDGMNRVLNAAAWTYVAAFIMALVQFLWYLMRMMNDRR